MGRMTAAAAFACALLTVPATALAQDDEADLDSLMQEDRELEPGERHDSEEEEEEEAEEEVPLDQMGDDEAPPEGWDGDSDKKKEPEPEPEADDGDSDDAFSVALLVGYGVSFEDYNPWGFGFGLRGGYNVGMFFIGGRFVYYVGETVTMERESVSRSVAVSEDVSVGLWELGAEAGLDIVIDSVTLRPGLGIGFASSTSGDSSEVVAHLSPGLTLLLAVSDSAFIGLDARFQAVLTELGLNGLPILATVGMKF